MQHAAPDTRHIARAVILRGIGGHGHAERHHGLRGDQINFLRGRIGGNSRVAQAVERKLQNNRTDRDDGRLKTHRKRDAKMLKNFLARDAPVLAAQMKHGKTPGDINNTRAAGKKLRGNGCHSRARHAHLKG